MLFSLSNLENYDTQTYLDYQPYKVLNGTEELPVQVLGQSSSYTQNAYDHNPRPSDVHSNYIDTSIRAPYDVLQKHRTKLDKINNRDPVLYENYGHVSFICSRKAQCYVKII